MDSPPLNRPGQRLAAIAATADPVAIQAFKPQSYHRAVAGALFTSDQDLFSIKNLVKVSGIGEEKIKEIMEDPAACSWILAHAAGIARFGLTACYARLLHMALTSPNPAWMSMLLKRFDPEFASDGPSVVNNTQINNYQHYSDAELLALVKQKSRRYLGAEAG